MEGQFHEGFRMSETVGLPPGAPSQAEREATAIRVPAFDVSWPKIAALAGAIVLSVGGGFWTLSSTIYGDLKEKLARDEIKNDSLDALTGVLRESVAKQGAQLNDLDKSVTSLATQIKESNADLTRQIGVLTQQTAQNSFILSAQVASLNENVSDTKGRLRDIEALILHGAGSAAGATGGASGTDKR